MIFRVFKGINNRLGDTSLPLPSRDDPGLPLRNAVNVDIDNAGNIIFPAWGTTKAYSGTDVHSWYEFEDALGYGLFVDNGSLKRLNKDDTATTLQTVNNAAMNYAELNGKVYFSNGIDHGIYDNGIATNWGVDNPPRQPDLEATTIGNLHAGVYRVAITWLYGTAPHYRESGTFGANQVTVAEGGGIRLTNFPTPTADVDAIAIYVSEVNSKDLYLYDAITDYYPATTSEVYLYAHKGTIALQSQFMVKPEPKGPLTVHNGGIFWSDGSRLHRTEPHWVHLYSPGSYSDFEDEILTHFCLPTGPLFVQTTNGLYSVSGYYSPEGPATPVKLRNFNGCKFHQVAFDPRQNEAGLWTDAGFVRITRDGVKDLSLTEFAAPHFESGAISFQDTGGVRKLVFVGRGQGVANGLQNSDFTADEMARSGKGI